MIVPMTREQVRVVHLLLIKTMKVIEFNQCPRSVHRELRNRFFDWFHQMEKLEHKSQYYGKKFPKIFFLILQNLFRFY